MAFFMVSNVNVKAATNEEIMEDTNDMPIISGISVKNMDVYYKNDLGIELTKTEYDEVVKNITPDELNLFTEEDINYIMEDYDKYLIDEKEIYVASGEENEPDRFYSNPFSMITREQSLKKAKFEDNVETAMKKITMKLYSRGASEQLVTLTCNWLTLPKTRSYDVIGLRPTNFAINLKDGIKNFSGFQEHDGKRITYSDTSSNIKKNTKGISLSTDLVDDAKKTLSAGISCTFIAQSMDIYGTYQHAQKKISLANSKNFSFSANGLGKVLKYNGGYESYYDNTPGLHVYGSILDYK